MLNKTTTEEPVLTPVVLASLGWTTLCFVLGLGVATVFKKSLSRMDFMVTVWLVFDILIHFTLELPFVVISIFGTVNDSKSFLAETWKVYAKADKRWGVSDPTIVSLEILTATIVEVFALVLLYAVIKQKFYRHFSQVFVCVCELYGGWMTFCPEWLTGSKNLVGLDSPLHFWLYLVFFNALWVICPLLLLWQSYGALKLAHSFEENESYLCKVTKEVKTITNTYKYYSKGTTSKYLGKDE